MLSKSTYLEDLERVRSEIWSLVDVKGKVVVDVGVGESTERLAELGAEVVGVDLDLSKLREHAERGVHVVLCDLRALPFREKAADLTVFCFTLHEINPLLHREALIAARKVSARVMIVEPSPQGCPTYMAYARILREAMHSVGRFEDYKPREYWVNLLREAGFQVTVERTIKWRVDVPYDVLREIAERAEKEWEELGVERKYVAEMRNLLEEVKRKGMKWSDINVVIGVANR